LQLPKPVGDKPLFFRKIDGNWQGQSWAEVNHNVRKLASVLVAAGVKSGRPGDYQRRKPSRMGDL
jgi:long-subunit acyl-CoA synthetase (AMP-forming)